AFLQSIELSPNAIPSNYLYVGQQCFGMDAVKAFTKAIELMEQQLKEKKMNHSEGNGNKKTAMEVETETETGTETKKEERLSTAQLRKEIARAHVSISELYMTDLCEEENAESECNSHLSSALETSPMDAEVHCTLGELRLIQDKQSEALEHFNKALLCIAKSSKSKTPLLLHTDSNDTKKDDDDDDDDDAWDDMTIDSFLKLAKLGMELNEFDNVLKIVYGVLQCDDNVGEAWALGSLAHYRLGRFEDASIWLENANA
ncbi:hypothetical protein RFI_26168, partial [Reticulomyxa filosa]